MQIKRFEARSMTEALRLVKREFGPDAVILSARSLKKDTGLFGSFREPGVEVTAATDTPPVGYSRQGRLKPLTGTGEEKSGSDAEQEHAMPGKGFIPTLQGGFKSLIGKNGSPAERPAGKKRADGIFARLYSRMRAQGIESALASELIEEIKRSIPIKYGLNDQRIRQCMLRTLKEMGVRCESGEESKKMRIAAVVGPTGVGKTTTIIKLAASAALNAGKQVGLITLDDARIGAVAQMKVYSDILGLSLESAGDGKALPESLKRMKKHDLVLIDTGGINPRDERRIESLRERLEGIGQLEIFLALSATTKDRDMADVLKHFRMLGKLKLIFTKLDESLSWGNIINQMASSRLSAVYFTTGPEVPDQIEDASIDRLLEPIFHTPLVTGDEPQPEEKRKENSGSGNERSADFLVANRNSDVFHRASCKSTTRIKSRNKIVFRNIGEALSRGYQPCRLCTPAPGLTEEASYSGEAPPEKQIIGL